MFQVVLDLPVDRREAWIEAQSEAESPLRSRLMAMLAGDELASLRTGGAADMLGDEPMPERIGAYRIVARIGRGGMGAVYRGERMTGDFQHTAAIKLIKPGLLSERLVERFQRERQTLATLQHPYIARLYDGGETADGAPFIVMELVDGQPLLDWSETHALSGEARLRLFGQICEAVAHAHQNLIVHRDITPSNVLVTGEGTIKLIDFGIAKPAGDGGGELPFAIAALTLTPGFAAPERLTGGEATTSGDIYSLGKLLAALVVSANDVELSAIVARATSTDPAHRYATVDALRADIEALRTAMPVAAMSGGKRYLARKFFERHRLGSVAAGTALGLLLIAFAATLWALDRAQTARAEAEERFGQLRSLAGYMIFDLNEQLARTVGNATARRNIVDRAQTYLSGLAASPDATPDIKLEAARGLISLAAIQGVPNAPNFGNREQARGNLNTAIVQLQRSALPAAVSGPDLANALAARAMIEAHADTDIERATQTLAKAEPVLNTVADAERGQRWLLARRAVMVGQLELAAVGQDAGGLVRLAGMLDAETRSSPAAFRQSRDAEINHALADYYRGIAATTVDDSKKAIEFLKAARGRFSRIDEQRPNDPALLYQLLWANYVGFGAASGVAGHKADAEDFLQASRRVIDRLVTLEPGDRSLMMFRGNIVAAEAQALSEKGRFREAESMQRSVIAFLAAASKQESKPGTLNRLVTAHMVHGNIALKGGSRALACNSYREARTLLSQLEARGLAVGSVLVRERGLDRNLARCAKGALESTLEPL